MIENIVFDFNGVILDVNSHTIKAEMLDLLKDLHELDFKLHIFSNTSKTTFKSMDMKYDFLKYFTNIIIAEDIGYSKPSNESFEKLFEVVNIPRNEIIYVDDGLDNIRQAEKYSMKAVKFVDADRLRISLHKLI